LLSITRYVPFPFCNSSPCILLNPQAGNES
jgi:hypothetical protein